MKTSRERATHSEQLLSNVGSGAPLQARHFAKLGHDLDVPVVVLVCLPIGQVCKI